jgi:hypothetical protein
MIPYAYPKLSFVPGSNPADPTIADLHAFRVDLTAKQIDVGETGEYSLTPISRSADGSISPLARVSVERGYYVLGIALNYNVGRIHTTRLRLYRPGYELVELESWDSADKIAWKPTSDLIAQEKAIDALLRRPAVTSFGVAQNRKAAADTQATPADSGFTACEETVLFAAAEYERVAGIAQESEGAARLRGKAETLRKLLVVSSTAISGSNKISNPGRP